MGRAGIFRQIFLDTFRSILPTEHRPDPRSWPDDRITGSCLGHSTVLLNFFGTWILTDPVFSDRVGVGIGPFIIGPKRYIRPALSFAELPIPDLILLSHAHFDHFDVSSLRKFSPNTPVITASKTGDLLRRFKAVHELAWEETIMLGDLKISAIEVKHWGARMLRDDYRGYNGYILEKKGRRICFAGDTAMTDSFAALPEKYRPLDLILMPIGAYNPWVRAHCNPEEAYAMSQAAGAKYFVPVHHQTFKLSAEPMAEPGQRIRRAFAAHPADLLAVDVGETFAVPSIIADHSL